MPKLPGSPKFGGRTKGTPNKKTQALLDRAKELGIDPFEILLYAAGNKWARLGYCSGTLRRKGDDGKTYTVDRIPLELRIIAAKEACQYIYPKRKAIEISTDEKNPIGAYLLMTVEERAIKRAELEAELGLEREKPKLVKFEDPR